ncbi:unnamed protein product [Effrenium voratum]|nr:unnamed protein product [Effrenium voratum]
MAAGASLEEAIRRDPALAAAADKAVLPNVAAAPAFAPPASPDMAPLPALPENLAAAPAPATAAAPGVAPLSLRPAKAAAPASAATIGALGADDAASLRAEIRDLRRAVRTLQASLGPEAAASTAQVAPAPAPAPM